MQLVRGDEHRASVTISAMHHEIQEPQPVATYSPQFFDADEFRTVEILAAMIIPTDDAPGAKEAQVANYIDFVVFSAAEFEPAVAEEMDRRARFCWNAKVKGNSANHFAKPMKRIGSSC